MVVSSQRLALPCTVACELEGPLARRRAGLPARRCAIIFLVLASLPAFVRVASAREWTDNTGKHSVEAELVEVRGDQVALKKPDGTVITVPIARLSVADRRYLDSLHDTGAMPRPDLAVAPFDADQAKRHQQAWAEYLGVPVEITNSIGMKLVLIPPGEFMMGASGQQIARLLPAADSYHVQRVETMGPQHPVRITRPFYLARHELTVGQFRQFVEKTGYKTEPERNGRGGSFKPLGKGNWTTSPEFNWTNPGFAQTDEHPVVCVTWQDAEEFGKWLSRTEESDYRLPTEAEWEHACRAGSTTDYWWGNGLDSLQGRANIADVTLRNERAEFRKTAAVSWTDGYACASPVGSFGPNPFGLHDMHGNVCEGCSDWFERQYYARSPKEDPRGPDSGTNRVARGGCWCSPPNLGIAAFRHYTRPTTSGYNKGFRIARSVPAR